jgi:hypothetical protein
MIQAIPLSVPTIPISATTVVANTDRPLFKNHKSIRLYLFLDFIFF